MNLQQVKTDLENDVLISPVTWLRVLEAALELKGAQDELVAALQMARVYVGNEAGYEKYQQIEDALASAATTES